MRNIAIIPARGGSKRIPRKNIKLFRGKPIIAYSIEAALQSNLFDEVMVSTDDDEIADVAVQYGASVPFKRSSENANDYAGTLAVLYEVIESYKSAGKQFDDICCIYATAPFVTPEKLKEAYSKLVNSGFNSVFPVVAFGYPIQRALKANEGKLQMFWPENATRRSQDLEKAYHDTGLFYWYTKAFFEANEQDDLANTGYIVYQEDEVQDIDTLTDWKIAEVKHSLLYPQVNGQVESIIK